MNYLPFVEYKYYDDIYSIKPYVPSRFAQASKCINVVPQGSGVNQRIGNWFTIKSILLRIQLTGRYNTGSSEIVSQSTCPQLIRIVMVTYNNNNYINRASGNAVVTNTLEYSTGTLPILSPLAMAKSDAFTVLFDKVYYIGGLCFGQVPNGSGGWAATTTNNRIVTGKQIGRAHV